MEVIIPLTDRVLFLPQLGNNFAAFNINDQHVVHIMAQGLPRPQMEKHKSRQCSIEHSTRRKFKNKAD